MTDQLRQALDFRDESMALHALIADLPAADFARETGFKRWSVDRILGHLHFWNNAADLSLRDPEAFQTLLAGVMTAMRAGGLREAELAWLAGLSGPALRDAWRDTFMDMGARWAGADPKRRVKWAGPDMSARSAITARLMETWAHGQAIHDLLGVAREDRDRIRNIVVLGVNTFGWSFAVRGEVPQGPMPRLRLTAPSGAIWEFGEGEGLIEGPAVAFCQVVTQTRNIADTDLSVRGATATRWMETAQCFAGPPETPPAPGARGPSGAIKAPPPPRA